MENVNKCKCLENSLRTHHGIVCTKCNPKSIDPFIVPESIKAYRVCLLYTSPSPRDKRQSRMPSSA